MLADDDRAELTEAAVRAPAGGVAAADPVGASARSRVPPSPSSPSGSPTSRTGCGPNTRRWPSSSTPWTGSTRWSRRGSGRRASGSTTRARPTRRTSPTCWPTPPTDPLSLSPQDVDGRIRAIADGVERRSAELAELAALQANWPEVLADADGTTRRVAGRDTARRADRVRAPSRRWSPARCPCTTDAEPDLRAAARVHHGAGSGGDAGRSATGPRRRCVRSARTNSSRRACWTVAASSRAGSPRTRRRRPASGLGEDPDLLASGRIAAGLLSRKPCDLRAVTRAITDYQQLIAQRQGKTR